MHNTAKHRTLSLAAALAIAIGTLAASPKTPRLQSPDALMGAAIHQQEVEGNPTAAIGTYKKILDDPRASRPLKAAALFRQGQCYEQLGQSEARKAYDQLLREYADQADIVAKARGRLARLNAPGTTAGAGMTTVQKWTGPKVDTGGTVSPDGRYLSFVDWITGDLALHDLTTGVDRRLTNQGRWSGDFAEESAISRDGTQVAYAWFDVRKLRYEVRLLPLNASGGVPAARTILDDPTVSWIAPYDWSPDGKSIVVALSRKGSQTHEYVALLDPRDGSLRIIKSVGGAVNRMFFSPDGELIAYDFAPALETTQRRVVVVSAHNGREIPAVVDSWYNTVVGWSPDGRALLFGSNRSGDIGIWALPFADGRLNGIPTLIKEVGTQFRESLGVTRSGALVYGIRTQARTVHIASIDFETGKALAPPVQAVEAYSQDNVGPDWSPDGKYLVYMTMDRPGAEPSAFLSILELGTGRIRSVRPQLNLRQGARPRWTRDGNIIVQGLDLNGRRGIYRVDPQTGAASVLVNEQPPNRKGPAQPSLSPDGTRLFYRAEGESGAIIVERELSSGAERELLRSRTIYGLTLSPDGRELAFIDVDVEAKTSALKTLEIHSGQLRELFRAVDPIHLVNYADWTPDGKRILYGRTGQSQDNSDAAWMIPRSGGTPIKLDLPVRKLGGAFYNPRVHPDGKRVAYVPGERKMEVWTLENFLPAAVSLKK